jgi:hypothetical protein
MKKPELLILLLIGALSIIIFLNENFYKSDFGRLTITGTGLELNPVRVTVVKPGCDCYDAELLVNDLIAYGLNATSVTVVNQSSELVSNYSLRRLPAIVFSDNILEYSFYSFLSFYGTLEGDGNFVFRSPDPPFLNVSKGEVELGEVTVTYVNHTNCSKCYDVTVHRDILETYKLNVVEEVFVNESSPLIEQYNITKLPTIILSPEAGLYSTLLRVWPGAGVVAEDGSLVFTNMDSIGTVWFYDLESGAVK